uniref:death domain-containing protein CRADD-like isoform X1 n=2 Tax=Myxine glutinosa TaxID=7769 RepID=UPI00358EB7D2
MESRQRRVLRRLREEISSQLSCDLVFHRLFQDGVLSASMLEKLLAEPTTCARARCLLDLLPTRGPLAFSAFCQVLRNDYPWLEQRLLEELQKEPAEEPDPLAGIPEEVLAAVPSERCLARLSGLLGPEWESLALYLGMSQTDISCCKYDHPCSTHNQKITMLIRWRRLGGCHATVQVLCRALRGIEASFDALDCLLRPTNN